MDAELSAHLAATRMSVEQAEFLRELMRWEGVAPRDLCAASRRIQKARATCKHRDWAVYDGGYWRITNLGREAWRIHCARQAA